MDISIITPSYNKLENLIKLKKNLDKFFFKYDFEWIVCLENDDTKSINFMQSISSEKIKFIHGDFKSGAVAFSQGLKIAKGKYINYNGDDDFKTENFFSVMDFIDYDYNIIHTRCNYVNENGKSIRIVSCYIKHILLKYFNYKFLKIINFIMTPAMLVDRELFIKAKGLSEEYQFANDYHAWLNILRNKKLLYVNLLSTNATYSLNTNTGSFRFSRFIELYKISRYHNKNNLLLHFLNSSCLIIIVFFNLLKLLRN